MAQIHEGKPWETYESTHSQIQDQITSTLKLVFLNISEQFYKHPFLLNFENSSLSTQKVVYDLRNLTLALFSGSFKNMSIGDPSLEFAFEAVLLLRLVFQYFLAFGIFLVATWIFNKLVLKSSFLTVFIETVASYIIFIPVLPPVLGFFGIVLGFRAGVWLYLKIFYNADHTKKISLLSPVDSFWAYETHGSCSLSVGLYVIQGTCDPAKIRESTNKTVQSDLVGGRMSRKLISVFGFPCWEFIETQDMKDYVKVVLDKGGPSTDSDVFEFMKTFQDCPIVDKAPWEVYIIPDFSYHNKSGSPKGSENVPHYAVIFRVHHCIMDGISTGNLLHSVMADKPFKFSIDPLDPIGPRLSKLNTFFMYLFGVLSVPRVALTNLTLMDNIHNRFFLPGPTLTGPKTFTWSRPIKMEGLKLLKKSTKTSVFSVLLSALGGAYRQLNLKNGTDTKAEYFHSMSPVALLPYKDRKPKNGFSYILVPFFVGKGWSPLKSLELNHKNIQELGSSAGNSLVIGNYFFPILVGFMPLFLQNIMSSLLHVKMSLSNVPGPLANEEVMIYGGDKIVDIGIWVPIKLSVGLGMGLFSYGDRVRASVIGDKVYFPNDWDVQFITDAFEEELTSLAKAVDLPQDVLFSSD